MSLDFQSISTLGTCSIFKYALQFSTNICTYVTNSPYWYELLLKPFD